MTSSSTEPEPVGAAPLDQLSTELQASVVAKAFAALADPIRLRIVELLAERGECSARALVAELPVSQPRVSVHLRCLTDCGFTTVRRPRPPRLLPTRRPPHRQPAHLHESPRRNFAAGLAGLPPLRARECARGSDARADKLLLTRQGRDLATNAATSKRGACCARTPCRRPW